MARIPLAALSMLAVAVTGTASAQTLYRYVDPAGRVVYSDQPPPPAAKDVQSKRLLDNVIETDTTPLVARQAAERFPVTLYTFDCDICRTAQALLARRGIPFETVIVTEEKGAERLKTLTGKQQAPVLQVGEKQVIVGYNEDRWQAVLDDAGYPKNPPPSSAQPPRPDAAPEGKAQPQPAAPEDAAPPARGHDYPK
jgi:glutaredoxin